MIDQKRPGAGPGERSRAGDLGRAASGLRSGAPRRARAAGTISQLFQAGLRSPGSAPAQVGSSSLPRLAPAPRGRRESRLPSGRGRVRSGAGFSLPPVAHGRHDGAGGLGRRPGVVDPEPGEQGRAEGDRSRSPARRRRPCGPTGRRRAGSRRRRRPRGCRAAGVRLPGRGASIVARGRSLGSRARRDSRRPPPPRWPPSCRSRSRSGGRSRREARLRAPGGRACRQELGGLAEGDLDHVGRILAAHLAEALRARMAGVVAPSVSAGGAGVGADLLPGECSVTRPRAGRSSTTPAGRRGEAGGEPQVDGRHQGGAAVDHGVLSHQDQLAGGRDGDGGCRGTVRGPVGSWIGTGQIGRPHA